MDKSFGLVPPIWHGPAAAAYIWEELGVYNRDILYSVAYHTTGRAGMSLFEKIIYIADLTSAERDYPDAERYGTWLTGIWMRHCGARWNLH